MVSLVALDAGVAIAAILIYFYFVHMGASKNYNWWGATVAKKGCDAKGCPHLPKKILKPEGFIFKDWDLQFEPRMNIESLTSILSYM